MENWLETDEQYDVLVSLSEVQHQVQRVADGDAHCWKWAIIAMASAVNGALTCNLSGTMHVGALEENDAKRKIAALQIDATIERPVNPRLARPRELLKRARRADKRLETAGPPLTISDTQKRAFERLIEFRNAFMHFEPLGWFIETSGMVRIFEEVLSIIEQTSNGGWAFRHLIDRDREQLQIVLGELRHLFAKLGKSEVE